MRVLLAIDDSKGSEAVIDAVIEQISEEDGEVKVLHVVELPSASVKFIAAAAGQMAGYPTSFSPELQAEANQAQALIARAAEVLASQGLKVTTAVEYGDPKPRIIEAAGKWGADLIVMGAHGRTGLERFLLGSVSEAVARHANCSVQIVRKS